MKKLLMIALLPALLFITACEEESENYTPPASPEESIEMENTSEDSSIQDAEPLVDSEASTDEVILEDNE